MIKKIEKSKPRRRDPLEIHRALLARAASFAHGSPEKGGSPHPTVKVGALLIGPSGKVLAQGANRFSQGLDRRRPERYENGDRSLWINCAEQMALADALRSRADLKGASLYVTLEPCAVCAGLIVEAGIRQVYVPLRSRRHYAKLKAKWKHSIDVGHAKLTEAGVRVTAVDTGEES